jgi:hypothetical protein
MTSRVMVVLKWEGLTPEHYEKARSIVRWETEIPKGQVFHCAGFHDNCMKVTDVWESASDFDAFVKNRLAPAAIQIGIPGQPEVEIFPLQNLFAGQKINTGLNL